MGWLAFNLAWPLVLVYAVTGFGWRNSEYSPGLMLAGTAHRPFAYRVLVPALMRPLVASGSTVEAAAILITAIALAGFVAALWWGWRLNVNQMTLMIVGLLPLLLKQTHVYDLPTLALFTGALAALAKERRTLYLVLFTVASLNRETAILLTVVYVLDRGLDRWTVFQLIVFAVIQLTIRVVLSTLPGESFETHWAAHLEQYAARPDQLVLYLLLAGVLVWAAGRNWQAKPLLLRQAAVVLAPILALSYFLVGYPFEFRVFVECYSPLALLAVWRV